MTDGTQTCFSLNGKRYGNNTQCPDSDSCCATSSQCRPDRLCTSNDNSGVIIRALCSNYPWTSSTCAQVCLYDTATGYLPRVNICADGSYCCDNNPTCCADKTGIILDDHGVAIGRSGQTTTSSTSSSSSSSITNSTPSTLSTSSTSSPSTTPTALSSSHDNTTVAIAVGVTIPCVFLICATIAFLFFWRHRSKRTESERNPALSPLPDKTTKYLPVHTYPAPAEAPTYESPPSELWTSPVEMPEQTRDR